MMASACSACEAAKVTPSVRRLRRCQRVKALGQSRAAAAAEKARQKNNSEVRAVKRITARTPSTSKPRIAAIATHSADRTNVSQPNSRQPSNQFRRSADIVASRDENVIIDYIDYRRSSQRCNQMLIFTIG